MDTLASLGRTLGFSLGAGINLYATVAILGLAQRFGWVTLPAQFHVFDHDVVIAVALVLYAIEFFADKIPWVDTLWDGLHSFVRPLGGALVAIAAHGQTSPTATVLVGLMGATVAASAHATKAGARAAANLSPEPVTNWLLSFGEDVFVMMLAVLALSHPVVALGVTLVALVLIALFARWIVRGLRRRFGRGTAAPRPA
jgi:hypothetical protein